MTINATAPINDTQDKNIILVIHQHEMVRHSVVEILAPIWTDMRIFECATLEDARNGEPVSRNHCLFSRDACALVLLIVSSNDQTSNAQAPEIIDFFDGIPVVLLSALNEQAAAFDAIRQGARGYLSGLMGVQETIDALRLVCAGGVYVGPMPDRTGDGGPSGIGRIGGPDLAMPPTPSRRPADSSALTPRETEVLRHLREGKPNKIIAYELGMSENTVKVHVGRIFKKLGASNRTVIACHMDAPPTTGSNATGSKTAGPSTTGPGTTGSDIAGNDSEEQRRITS